MRLPWYSKSPPAMREHPVLASLAILACGLGLTIIIAVLGHHYAKDRIQARVDRQVQRTYLSMQDHLFTYEGLLRGGRGLFEVREKIAEDEWRRFVEELDLPHRYPSVKGLAYIERVPGGAGEKFLIRYSEPALLNPHAVGYDIGIHPEQRGAAVRAMESGMSAITAPIYFNETEPDRPAFGLLLPVYKPGTMAFTTEARKAAHVGWISAAIYLDTMMDEVMREMDPDFATQIIGGNHPVRGSLAYQHNMGSLNGHRGATPARQLVFKWGDRAWAGRVIPLPSFDQTADYRWPLWALVAGCTISSLLAGLAWSLISTRARAEAIAKSMTLTLEDALRRHESHVENTPLAVIEWDQERKIRAWNPAAARIFGYTETEALARGMVDLLAPPGGSAGLESALEQAAGSKAGTHRTLECRAKNGQTIICGWHCAPLLGAEDEFLGATTLIEDLTQARQREAALRQGQKLESLGLLAGGIAHDFNNILTALLGNLDAAVEATDERSPAMEHLLKAITSAERAGDLSTQILVYSGKGAFTTREVLLNQIVEEMTELLEVSRPPRVNLRLQLAPDLPFIQADPVQMQQVVLNLVLNATEAIEANQQGGDAEASITLTTSHRVYSDVELETAFSGQDLLPGPYVSLRVKDSGCGMDEATLPRIFDPFFTTKATGRGLGLSTLQGIVKAHHGGMWVNSKPGAGTTFNLLFPAAEAMPSMPRKQGEGHHESQGAVLLVEDEEAIRTITALALSKAGFEVLTAADGLEALRLFEANAEIIRSALVDKVMPGMGGAELMQAMRARKPGLRVVLCSGYSESGFDESDPGIPSSAADAFLQKPYRTADAVELIRKLMGPAVKGEVSQ
ncbi:MAG: CHASE domain-containing protein [Holophagaceae bacterium]|nr:CHASE domain-containing protein [Holophagaceae bacterium]